MIFFYTKNHLLHDATKDESLFPSNKLEDPKRIEIIISAIRHKGMDPVYDSINYGISPITDVHNAEYIDFLRTVYPNWRKVNSDIVIHPLSPAPRNILHKPKSLDGLLNYYSFGNDPIFEGTWEASYWSAQTAISAAIALKNGELLSYALCRPPGHHASKDSAGGFCYLNNAAIAARFLNEKVAILDIDYHHGNGTQSIFYDDPSILVCSIHSDPDIEYPYFWGTSKEIGIDKGIGYNFNFPLPRYTEDHDYLTTLIKALNCIRDFAPKYLVVSVGYDIMKGDPLGGFNITVQGLIRIAQKIKELKIPTLLIQEGGYDIKNLPNYLLNFVDGFL